MLSHNKENIDIIKNSLKLMGFLNFRFCAENDCYAVSECGGVIRVCRRQRSKSGNIIEKYESVVLKGSYDCDGYITYKMTINGIKKHVKGHRLVLNAFLGESHGLVVNHKNGIKSDNRLCNLEWCTIAENNRHAIDTGLFNPVAAGEKYRKIQKYDYMAIYAMAKHAKIPRAEIAKKNNVCRQTIDEIIKKVDLIISEIFTSLELINE